MKTHNNLYQAFTLIELLIVIIIVGILMTTLVPRLIGAQGVARNAVRLADIKQLQGALSMYAADHGGDYPMYYGSVCIGGTSGNKCRPGFTQNAGPTGVGLGNETFNALLLQYMNSIPRDPSPTRTIGELYIYGRRGNTAIHCNGDEYVHNKSWLARQPEKIGPHTDEACAPGKRACCAGIGCGSHTFCVLQLD